MNFLNLRKNAKIPLAGIGETDEVPVKLALEVGKPRPDRFCRGCAVCVIGVIVQLFLIRGNAKETSARQVYMSYSEATLKYPELSQPNLDKIKTDPVEYVRYKNYVSHMLFAFDEILTSTIRQSGETVSTKTSSTTCATSARAPRRNTTKCIFRKCANFWGMQGSGARPWRRSDERARLSYRPHD